jgi:hypothetical protein
MNIDKMTSNRQLKLCTTLYTKEQSEIIFPHIPLSFHHICKCFKSQAYELMSSILNVKHILFRQLAMYDLVCSELVNETSVSTGNGKCLENLRLNGFSRRPVLNASSYLVS